MGVAAVGLVAVGVTVTFGVMAWKAENDKPSSCTPGDATCTGRWSTLDQQRGTDATVATIAGGVSVAAAAAAVVLLVLPRSSSRRDQAWTVAPFGLAGASLAGRF